MRRSICICEPQICLAGEEHTFKFSYTTATTLLKGAKLKFDLMSKGRSIDWEIPSTNTKEKRNLIWAQLPDGTSVSAKAVDKTESSAGIFEFTLSSEVKTGETLTIFIGSPTFEKTSGNRCQTLLQRRRPFVLSIDPKGKGDFREHETFSIDVRGNTLSNIRILAPSVVARNQRFDVIARFEDQYGNLTSNAPEGTLIQITHEHLRESLNWKRYVPETGFIKLPNLYFNQEDIYKFKLQNLHTGEIFYSAPIKCVAEASNGVFWGLLHGETIKADSKENIESCLRYFRDEAGLNFFATSCFENAEETPNEIWKSVSHHISEFNEDQRFNTFLGFQYKCDDAEEGMRELVYYKENRPILRKKDAKSNSLKKIFKNLAPKEMLSIPLLSMCKGFQTDFSTLDPLFDRVVEIYNAFGSSECSSKKGNPRPIQKNGAGGAEEYENGSIVQALKKNIRFGFVAGGSDYRANYAKLIQSNQTQYSPGLTAVLAPEQNRESILDALYNRSCYATTGERIILGFMVGNTGMGKELSTKTKPGLSLNRYITGYVAGTANIKEVSIVRNGEVLKSFNPNHYSFEFEFDDFDLLTSIVLKSPDERPPFIFYYLRVTQEDGHIAWSSPIWIDYYDSIEVPTPVKKVKKKGLAS